jgi:branched-chain amino acid transport system ATP-binding protein
MSLDVHDLVTGYGAADVLHGVSVSVAPGTVTAVIGANGAGKTTLLRAISGVLPVRGGSVTVDGRSLAGLRPREIVRSGVVHVPEGRQVFAHLTVRENLELGGYVVRGKAGSGTSGDPLAAALEVFPALVPMLERYAGTLSGGQQQMLAIGRGLAAAPRFLLLDEPSLGLAPQVVANIFAVVDRLRRNGVGVLLVEQNGRLALDASEQALVLERGDVVLQGPSSELAKDPQVIERYLGVGAERHGSDHRHDRLVEGLRAALAK